jgi:carbonic anhydrase/acetyltransferase-like protein (isoleucine patch superfamily)
MIEMGTEIGDCCYVHGHSVVRGRLPPRTVASGNPARIIGSVAFDDDGCPRFQFNRAGVELFAGDATRPPDGDA